MSLPCLNVSVFILYPFLQNVTYCCCHIREKPAAASASCCSQWVNKGFLDIFRWLHQPLCGGSSLFSWRCAAGSRWGIQMDHRPAQSYPAGAHTAYISGYFLCLVLVYPPLVRMGFSCPVWKCDQWPLLKRHTLLMLPAAVVQFSGRRSSLSWYYVCTTTVMWPRGRTTNWLWYETPTSFLIENTISLLDLDTSAMLVFYL